MKIQFEKKTDLSGDTFYHIKIDGWCIKSFPTGKEVEAATFYKDVLKRLKNGGETIEILAEETITPKP